MIEVWADENSPQFDSKEFKPIELPFETLNPVQSAALPFIDEDVNLVVSAPTASGKTLIATMAAAEAISHGKSALYASPFKALTQERYEDWGDKKHPFHEEGVAILTGDYAMTDKLKRKLNEARFILLTSEMVDARARQGRKERLRFLNDASVMIADEIHLLGMDQRGDRLETGLMALTKNNPKIRLVFLSATMGNAEQIAEWATKLNGKETVLLLSEWRPTKLTIEMYGYRTESRRYREDQIARINSAVELFYSFPEDGHRMIVVHGKKDGNIILKELRSNGTPAEFYNSGMSMVKRRETKERLLAGDLKNIIATSALTTGVNLPSTYGVVVGNRRGLSFVDPVEIQQAIGRLGRPQWGKDGIARITVKDEEVDLWDKKIRTPPFIQSQLTGDASMRFHMVSLIDRKRAQTPEELQAWQERSLMAFQGRPITESKAEGLFHDLTGLGIIEPASSKTRDSYYRNTFIGKIASRLYFDPMAILQWLRNWNRVSQLGLFQDDQSISWAVGSSVHFDEVHPGEEAQAWVDHVVAQLSSGMSTKNPGMVGAIYAGLIGKRIPNLAAPFHAMRQDIWRMVSAWKWSTDSAKIPVPDGYFERLGTRLSSGCSWEAAEFCRVPGIGPVTAQRLLDEDIRTVHDYLATRKKGGKRELTRELLGERAYNKYANAMVSMIEKGDLHV